LKTPDRPPHGAGNGAGAAYTAVIILQHFADKLAGIGKSLKIQAFSHRCIAASEIRMLY
jgi:hypothetical protein